jgi:hypothetical protein
MVPSIPRVLTEPVTDLSDLMTMVPVPLADVVTAGTSWAPLSLSETSAENAEPIALTSSTAVRAISPGRRIARNILIGSLLSQQQGTTRVKGPELHRHGGINAWTQPQAQSLQYAGANGKIWAKF